MKKKLIYSILSLMCVITTVQAQIHVGVEAGLNLSTVKADKKNMLVGPVGGITFDYTFQNNIAIISGLQYTMKGAKKVEAGLYQGNTFTMDVNLGYLELPLMIGYKIPIGENIRLVPAAGGYIACGINGKAEFKDAPFSHINRNWGNPFQDINMKEYKLDGFNRFDGGFRFMLSAEISQFTLSASYDLGMKDTWKSNRISTYELKNRNFAFSVGYKFSL